MSNIFNSSIGRKLIQSISGIFLILFLIVHLSLNLLLLLNDGGNSFNIASHFMSHNPVMHVIEYVLALGFIIHITYASILTLQNQRARPIAYKVTKQSQNCSWASRNMFILGSLILTFLIVHLINFFF